jgi:hypothetical protein
MKNRKLLKPKLRRAGRDRKGWRMVLVGRNGEPVWWGEVYSSKQKAEHSLTLTRDIDYSSLKKGN